MMSAPPSVHQAVEQDIWRWIAEFVTVPHGDGRSNFPPCPYARQAVLAGTVDVKVLLAGDVRGFMHDHAMALRDNPALTTRVMTFPPRTRWHWGISDYVETLNATLIPDNVFLNTGVARTTRSRYPGADSRPYFIVVANRLDAVLEGCESLKATHYYEGWPAAHYRLVVERRARMVRLYGPR
jgi:hypothetical protein